MVSFLGNIARSGFATCDALKMENRSVAAIKITFMNQTSALQFEKPGKACQASVEANGSNLCIDIAEIGAILCFSGPLTESSA